MTENSVVSAYKTAYVMAARGVDYTPQNGAVCPWCGKPRMRVYSSPPSRNGVKFRYHKCSNPDCLLSRLDFSVKSAEIGEET